MLIDSGSISIRSLLRVCDLVPKKFGSFERFLVGLGRLCRKRGVRLGLVLAGEPVPVVAAAFREHGIQWWVIPELRSASTIKRRTAFIRNVTRIIRSDSWDVVSFSFCTELNVICACLSAKLLGAPRFKVVWEQHSEITLPAGFKRHLSWLRLVSPLASAFIGLSKAAATCMALRVKNSSKVRCIYNGVAIPQSPRRLWLRKELRLPDSATLIVNVGGLIPLKAQDVLIDAAAPLLRAAPDRHLLIVGGGPLEGALRDRAKALGVGEQVHLLGIRNDVPDLLADCDLFVLPSRTEALPYSVIEAMSVGLPVIATRVGGLSDLVSHEETGLLVPPDDVIALRNALERLLEEPAITSEYGAAGFARVCKLFSLERSIGQRFALYQHLTGGLVDGELSASIPAAS